jgi:hypothetical protein
MRSLILAAAALALGGLAPLATSTQARAEIEYAWCGYARDIGQTCSFSTRDQCRAWLAGAGDCYNNPRYTAVAPATRSRR